MLINICIGSACHIKGSYNVITAMQQLLEEEAYGNQLELKSVFCLGHCQSGVSVQLDDDPTIYSVTPDSVKEFYATTVLPKLLAIEQTKPN